jgi:hypothetical protein
MSDQPEAVSSSPDGDFVFTGDSDISAEEQRELLTAIDRVSQENRIAVSPEAFRYRPTRKGFVLPLLVNAAAVLALVAGVLASSFIGRRDDRRLSEGVGVLRSAEGRLMQELRRELEDRLRGKDLEIAQVQGRLESIRSERDRLASTMEEKIRQREQELRQALEGELAAERARLLAAGETQERIAVLLDRMEAARTAENREQLEVYRRQLQAERLALETDLGRLQGEYEGQLNALNRDRASLLAEYDRKEESLRQDLEQQKAQLSRQEQQARQELELIKAQEQKEDRVEAQILGFYSSVQKSLVAGDPGGALASLEMLARYLEDPELRSLPEVEGRLRIDRFLAAELDRRIRGEMEQSSTRLSELLGSAQLLDRLRESAQAAQALAADGQQVAAARQYRSAFNLVPALLAGLELIVGLEQEKAAAERRRLEQRLQEAAAEQRRLEQRLAIYGAPQPAAAAPRPEPAAAQPQPERLASAQPQDVPEAARILESAEARNQRGEYQAAIEEYLRLLRGYPLSRQAAPALEGVRRAASLQETREQGELRRLRQELQRLEGGQAALREELDRLRPLAERQSSLAAGYAEYVQREGPLEEQAPPKVLFQAKQYLDAFLASEPVRQLFPGFLDRIHRYDLAFEQGGREEAVSELIDLVYDLSSYETNRERLQFLQKEIERQRGNPIMQEFLKELSNLLKS